MHAIATPAWVKDRALIRFDEINLPSSAIVVVDMQAIFVEPGARFSSTHTEAILPNVNRLIAAVRAGGGTVIFTRHTTSDEPPYALPAWHRAQPRLREMFDLFRPDTPGHRLVDGLDRLPNDIIVDKYRYSALAHNSSRLGAVLEERGIDTVVVVGVATNCCCETTARDASQLGYKTFFITDATATLTDDEHNAALINLSAIFTDARSTEEMLQLCAKGGA
jgi:nicotinamidase-related amidase